MSIDKSADESNWKPETFFNYVFALPPNNGFLAKVERHSSKIGEILNRSEPPPGLEDAIFVVGLNGARKDLIQIIEILREIGRTRYIVNFDYVMRDAMTGAVQEFIRRAGDLYNLAYDYQRHISLPSWRSTAEGAHLPMNILSNSPFYYRAGESPRVNAERASASFIERTPYLRNFLNVLYGDGKEGEAFLGRSFKAMADEYRWIEREAKKMKKHFQRSEPKKTSDRISELYANLHKTMKRHPSTIFRAMEEIINFIESSGDASD